ncbi:teneurin-a-like [Lingula anatina]|uniref:Teneurin-a-like n=1 Tax=Lingula anatina TaxID=7574 RepID=A0A1S3IQC5_LINAN|nr:teneurin-a-like [Lingula anatina]|eukprot:XP_013399739.1 teneurin-a-like [Lingula anatina]
MILNQLLIFGYDSQYNHSCQCDKCPDGKTKKVITDDPSQPACPCHCADGWPREMNADGTCECGCECPNGGYGTVKPDGGCHCSCECKNCQNSVITSDGTCYCPNDICPVCDSAYEPVWEDCRCVCREKTQCGLYPACVRGRRGEQCDQPDCEPCSFQTDNGLQECFGNGVCTLQSYFCSSRCECFQFWTGVCCNVRIPRNMGGDPHLQTADGISYDYHGIGEFWDCMSTANDFGVQVRFFGYKQASLVGAAAVKVGHSVATITTPVNATETTLPTLRIDGLVQSITKNNTRLTLNNDTVIVDIAKVRNNATGAVMMIAIQYDTGCPGQCNGKGRCVNSTCQCNDGWTGTDCSIGSCGACVNGVCDSGFCVCTVGWEGTACDQKATCLYVNNCTDEDHGVCYRTNRCRCLPGFVGMY